MANIKYFSKMSRRSFKEIISGTVEDNVRTVINRYSVVGADNYEDAVNSAESYARLNGWAIASGQVINRHMIVVFKGCGKKHFRRYNW